MLLPSWELSWAIVQHLLSHPDDITQYNMLWLFDIYFSDEETDGRSSCVTCLKSYNENWQRWAWWRGHVFPGLRRQRQKGGHTFEATMVYMANSRPARVTQWNSILKEIKQAKLNSNQSPSTLNNQSTLLLDKRPLRHHKKQAQILKRHTHVMKGRKNNEYSS